MCDFFQDILDALFWTATEPRGRKRDHLGKLSLEGRQSLILRVILAYHKQKVVMLVQVSAADSRNFIVVIFTVKTPQKCSFVNCL